jgi:hypothetical protein
MENLSNATDQETIDDFTRWIKDSKMKIARYEHYIDYLGKYKEEGKENNDEKSWEIEWAAGL